MKLLPFKLFFFFASFTLGMLAVALLHPALVTKTSESGSVVPGVSYALSKSKKVVCTLDVNVNKEMSCKCKEVDE